ncbi:MAG: 3-phosphoshikimate 1-carboxyvinyltransferase [Bacteroidia bacterium]
MPALSLAVRFPIRLRGRLRLPGSKSISNRLLVMRALAGSATELTGLSIAQDTELMLRALEVKSGTIHAGPAGTVMRFLLPYLCLQQADFMLEGSDRAHERPIAPLVFALQQMGAAIEYVEKEGYPPLKIGQGLLRGGQLNMEAGMSSQFISALLLVAPYLPVPLRLQLLGNAVSVPYVRQTVQLMKAWGAEISWEQHVLQVAAKPYQAPKRFAVEPDWSSAAYWLAFAALLPETDLILDDLPLHTEQADKQAAVWMAAFGCKISEHPGGLRLRHQQETLPMPDFFDGRNCPDLIPALVVLAAVKNKPARFTGLQSLRLKESDRLEALRINLEAAGAILQLKADELTLISGIKTGTEVVHIRCFDDHRMAMAFSLLAAVGKRVVFDQPEVVAKSYPTFWEDLASFGFSLTYRNGRE